MGTRTDLTDAPKTPKGEPPPAVGSDIYVRTSRYLSHGRDDFQGGLCKVAKVTTGISAGQLTWFVEVEERPGTSYNWEILRDEQAKLKSKYGDTRGYEDPDNDPSANDW
jgi:hypothetical protein